MRILVIEDDEITSESMQICLHVCKPGLIIDSTNKGLDGILKLKSDNYNAIILDLGLPDIDGLEAIMQIRTFSKIPLIVVSARHSPEVINEALKAGANEYITKPFNYNLFINKLDKLIQVPS